MKKNELYRSWHKCCPICGSDQIEESIVGYIILGSPDTHEDKNSAKCKCGWRGIVHNLVAPKSITEFKSYSQAGQDRFAHELVGHGGLFLDIGAQHPTEISNTYGLEQIGWSGFLVENDPLFADQLKLQRRATVFQEDATKINWAIELMGIERIGYLSLDVDESSLVALENLLPNAPRFRCMTIEHDAYRFGNRRRLEMCALLQFHKYDILCSQVCCDGCEFEIWAVDPLLVDMAKAERFRRDKPTEWKFWL